MWCKGHLLSHSSRSSTLVTGLEWVDHLSMVQWLRYRGSWLSEGIISQYFGHSLVVVAICKCV